MTYLQGLTQLPRILATNMSILFVGGSRSGKSYLAECWANAQGPKRLFVATAKIEDDETKARITTHQARRGDEWQCLEAPYFSPEQVENIWDVVLIDCLSMWLNNRMSRGDSDADILRATEDLAQWVVGLTVPIALVSGELGQGMVPMSALARRYRDLHGIINQHIAKACNNVLLISCGLPLAIKGTLPEELKTM